MKINEAYNVLSKESSRRDYDLSMQIHNFPSGGADYRSWPSTEHPGNFRQNDDHYKHAENDPFVMGNRDYQKNRE